MNVLQVNTVYPNGSTGRIVAEIAAYTAKQPDAHAFAAFGIGTPEKQENVTALRIGTPLERKVHGALRKLLDAEGYGSRAATKQLIRFCEENHIDVVHLHNLHGCYLNLKRWFRYLKEKNLPVIWTLHDCWPLTGHCAHFDYCGCDQWKTLCRRCPQKKYYPQCIGIGGSKRNYRFKRRLFTSLENLTVVTPCRWLEGIVKQSFLKNTPIRAIYNGVDTRQFRPIASDIRMQYGLKDKQVLLAVASVWNNRKGLKAIAELSKMLDEKYRIVIVGLSPEQIRVLPENIVGLGPISDPMMLCAWYGAADCFVNPTLEDTMPLVNLEALACGTPVAMFNTGGCPEAITEACGRVVDKGDIRGMKEAVEQICESGVDWTDACVAQAQRFSMENTVRAYDALYREVLE